MQESRRPETAAGLDHAGRRAPSGQAVDRLGRRRPHRHLSQLHDVTGQIAAVLHGRGIGRNDRVALLANNSIEHLACYFGVMAYGATICTMHVEMNRNQLDDIFARTRPQLVLLRTGSSSTTWWPASARRACGWDAWESRRRDVLRRGRALCAERRADHGAAGRRRGDPVHLGHQRAAQGRGADGIASTWRTSSPTADGFGITADDRIYDFRSFNWASAQLLGALVPVNRGATLVMAAKFSASRFFQHIRDAPRDRRGRQSRPPSTSCSTARSMRSATTCRRCASSRRARRRSRSRNGAGSRRASAFRSRRATARARPAGSRRSRGSGGGSARWAAAAYHDLAIVDAEGRRLAARRDRRRSRSEASAITTTATSPTTAASGEQPRRIRTGDLGLPRRRRISAPDRREKEIIIRGGVNISPVEIDSLPDAAPGADRGRDRRRAGRDLRRGGGELRGGAAGRARRCRRAAALLQRRPAGFKAPKRSC